VVQGPIWLFCSKLRERLELAKSKRRDSIHLLESSQAWQTISVLDTDDSDGIRASRCVLIDGDPGGKLRAPGVVDPRVDTHAFFSFSFSGWVAVGGLPCHSLIISCQRLMWTPISSSFVLRSEIDILVSSQEMNQSRVLPHRTVTQAKLILELRTLQFNLLPQCICQ
jgi:hypothetical protein